MKNKIIKIYKPPSNSFGSFATLFSAVEEIYQTRHVIWHLFKRDFKAQFRQTLMGYCWIIITPIMGIIPFVFLTKVGILKPGEIGVPYSVFIVMGMGMWGLLTASFSVVSRGLENNQELLVKTNIPKVTFAITGMAGILYSLMIHTIVVIIFLIILDVEFTIWAIGYPLLIIPIIIFGAGLGLVFSVIGLVARDLNNIMSTILNLMMFLSPVVYKPEFNNNVLATFIYWNPFSYLVDVPRNFLITGELINAKEFVLASLTSIIVLIVGLHSFYLIKDKVTERL